MAVTATLVKSTPGEVAFLLNQDGAAGTTLIITAAVILAAATAGPLRDMPGIGSDITALTTALARQRMLGDFVGATDDALKTPHCSIEITHRAGATADAIAVDADTDAANALRAELNVIMGAAAATAYLRLRFCHTLTI